MNICTSMKKMQKKIYLEENEKMKTKNQAITIEKSKKFKNSLKKVGMVLAMTALYAVPVLAAPGADTGVAEFNAVILFIAGWIAKLGMVVGFFGAVQCAFGFKNDDADGKVKGLRTMISGFIVFAIANEATLSALFGIK